MSLSAFDSDINQQNSGASKSNRVDIEAFTKMVKETGLNLRLTVILTDYFDDKSAEWIMKRAKELGADQITFKVLYNSKNGTEQDNWIGAHRASEAKVKEVTDYVAALGAFKGHLDWGAKKYLVSGMSVVVDDDCMSKEVRKNVKTLILRENGKLYTQWDDPGSLEY